MEIKMTYNKLTTHAYAILDGQYGSCGKGLIAGYLAETRHPTAVVCAYGPNSGHTYITRDGTKFVVTQIPVGAISPRCKGIFIGPGSVINPSKMSEEIHMLSDLGLLDLRLTDLIIHECASVVTDEDLDYEKSIGLAKIGSTLKGSMAAFVKKLWRQPDNSGMLRVARCMLRGTDLAPFVVTESEYNSFLQKHGYITQIEGAQGFSLSLNHGFYPYVTSRDVTPLQTFSDCGIPYDKARKVQVYQSLRTYPIRVNNREGSSGPGYPDQREMDWSEIGIEPELTTVTKLPRRIFEWSDQQTRHMDLICGTPDGIFLNFVNYVKDVDYMRKILDSLHGICGARGTGIRWVGVGPSYNDVIDILDVNARKDPRLEILRAAAEEHHLHIGD